jgi:hypothetical protein
MPPPPFGAYHWHWTLNYRYHFHYQNHRFFRVKFGGWKGGFNGLMHGEQVSSSYHHYFMEFKHFYTYSASPMWTKPTQVLKNYFGKTGWAAYRSYQDQDFEDMPVSNRYSVAFNGLVFKQISRRQNYDAWYADPWTVYGEIQMKPSQAIMNKNTWKYFNTYGLPRGKRRFNSWWKYPLVRIFPGRVQHHRFNFAVSSFVCMWLGHRNYVNRYAIEDISGYYGNYPAMHAYRRHAWRWGYWNDWKRRHSKGKDQFFSYRFSFIMLNHWWPQHAKNVHYSFWNNYLQWTNGNIWSHYFRELDPRVVVGSTEEGLENQFVPVAFIPRVVTASVRSYSGSRS